MAWEDYQKNILKPDSFINKKNVGDKMKKSICLLFIIITFCISCDNLNKIQTKLIPPKDMVDIVNQKQKDVFNDEKCWWVKNTDESFQKKYHKFNKEIIQEFKRCSLEVDKNQFPELNQLEAPDEGLTNQLKAKCSNFNDDQYVLIDYFWSKSYNKKSWENEGIYSYLLYGLCLKTDNIQN
ncbi:hypothetical protein MHK_004330 [Candidatus Magnetomorum sp. HK-1]|nr:hypothetical protein MHK_004330 [Candidatus Magnetomorum sp. HK-1]